MKILLVDDEPDILTILSKELTKRTHSVECAENGQIAYDIFVKSPESFDVIISDLRMPVLDGMSLLKKIKKEKHKTPLILVTGHGDLKSSIEALRLGAYDFILKPFEMPDLSRVLSRLEALRTSEELMKSVVPLVDHLSTQITTLTSTSQINGIVNHFKHMLDPYYKLHNIDSHKMNLVLFEALSNAMFHGNLEIDSKIKNNSLNSFYELVHERESIIEYANKEVIISLKLTQKYLEFEIRDQGKGFDWKSLPTSEPIKMLEYGRGLLLMNTTMDHISWNPMGNSINMVKNLGD